MLYQNLYGASLPAAEMVAKHRISIEPAPPPNAKTKYRATVYAFREHKQFELVVPLINKDGLLIGDPQFQIAVAWQKMESGRPNLTFDSRYPVGETFSLAEVLEGVPAIYAGTGNDGPPYHVFVSDDDGEIVSEVASVGWVGDHITMCPVFLIEELGDSPSSPTDVDIAAIAKEVVRHLIISVQAV